jgi:multiple sugar transport system substrate-binding protein
VFVFSTFNNLFFDITFRRKRMKIRLSPIIVAVLIASLILAACSPAEATPTPAAPAATGTPSPDQMAPSWARNGGCVQRRNPDIQVTMNSQSDYYTQLTTAAASDTLPDVAIVHADQVATQAFRNVLRPIDDMVTQMGVTGSDFPAAVWAPVRFLASATAIPLDIHPMTMFYNADLLQRSWLD